MARLIKHQNGITIKHSNKRISVYEEIENVNFIEAVSLTSETSKELGADSEISENGKVKTTTIGFTDLGLEILYLTLSEFFKNKKISK